MNIVESNMVFGPYRSDQVFPIEVSKLHREIGKDVKTVEFLLCPSDKALCFVEAKSSSPQPGSPGKFDTFIEEIASKFLHSFDLYYSGILRRHGEACDIPDRFYSLNNSTIKFKLYLVIYGHEEIWLPPINAALNRRLAAHVRIWGTQISVINEKMALRRKFISGLVT